MRSRQLQTLVGVVHWQRRVGRCPNGCKGTQVALLDDALGLSPHQQTSLELVHLGCLLAVFVSLAEAKEKFDAVGAPGADRIVAYCGGGISATVNLFLMHQLGYDNIALYDGSMGEWASDKSLPIERG